MLCEMFRKIYLKCSHNVRRFQIILIVWNLLTLSEHFEIFFVRLMSKVSSSIHSNLKILGETYMVYKAIAIAIAKFVCVWYILHNPVKATSVYIRP